MPRVSAAKTALAPRHSRRNRLLSGKARNTAITSGTESGFLTSSLGQRTAHTLTPSTRRVNRFGTPLRASRPQIYLIAGLALLTLLSGVFINGGATNRIVLGKRSFIYELAQTSEELRQGLSGRTSLPTNRAMLFVFIQSAKHCFWMKDMRFGLDIIWLDENKQVIFVKENVQPDTYPQSFCSNAAARYVVEVNAGQADTFVGDTAKF